jgi:uncharacterized protein
MHHDEIIEEVAKIIQRHLSEGYRVMLFGSWARGTAEERSDIDIGIMGTNLVPQKTLVRMKQEIEGIPTLRSIDIVDLKTKSPEFREHALKTAIPIEYA